VKNELTYNDYRVAVPPAFEDVVTHFYFAENKSHDTVTKTLLPSFQTILIFSFGSAVSFTTKQNTEVEIEKCLVVGPIKKAVDYSLLPNAEILVVNFKDDAFFRFFGDASIAEHVPIHPDELFNENCLTSLWFELKKISDTNLRVNHILEFCKPYLRDRNSITKQITDFEENSSLNLIKAIAEKNELSERAVQIAHKKQLGYSAKELNRYQRFLKAVQLIQNIASDSSKMDWFEVIDECGYYDQSQLIHDFKYYINLSPTKYLKFQQDICSSKG
jgi:AraC-like DNA-binding protein